MNKNEKKKIKSIFVVFFSHFFMLATNPNFREWQKVINHSKEAIEGATSTPSHQIIMQLCV
jgi:hypothetical protein